MHVHMKVYECMYVILACACVRACMMHTCVCVRACMNVCMYRYKRVRTTLLLYVHICIKLCKLRACDAYVNGAYIRMHACMRM